MTQAAGNAMKVKKKLKSVRIESSFLSSFRSVSFRFCRDDVGLEIPWGCLRYKTQGYASCFHVLFLMILMQQQLLLNLHECIPVFPVWKYLHCLENFYAEVEEKVRNLKVRFMYKVFFMFPVKAQENTSTGRKYRTEWQTQTLTTGATGREQEETKCNLSCSCCCFLRYWKDTEVTP